MQTKILLIGLLIAVVALSGCLSEQQINQEIEKANYCSVDDDCTVAFFGCPFGCGSYVNKDSVDSLKTIVREYQDVHLQCEYSCMRPPMPVCKEAKCAEKICETNKEYNESEGKTIDGVYYWPCACPDNSTMAISDEKEKGIGTLKCIIKESGLQKITDLCEKEKEFSDNISSSPGCIEKEFKCVDGWESTIYYDSRITNLVQTGEVGDDMNRPQEITDAAIAVHGTSVCSCEKPVSYNFLTEGKTEETTCENFYKFIDDVNASCSGCILTWATGCC